MRWLNRSEAGRALAAQLQRQGLGTDPAAAAVVVALPRGGVPVAVEVARLLALPVTTWAVRKLALPDSPEFAIGAVAAGGVVLWDPESSRALAGRPDLREALLQREQQELERRQRLFGDWPAAALRGRELIVIDDGIATGMTVRAALTSLRAAQPRRLVLAVPVLDRHLLQPMAALVDELVVLAAVERLVAVGWHYEHFEQLSDQDVLTLLQALPAAPPPDQA